MAHKVSQLKNGITLITVPVVGTSAVTLMAMYPIGSRYETHKVSGAAHFLEHMLFKGTKRRPTARDISSELEAVGADYNAFTYKDHTGYYIKINAAKQSLAFDVLSDMLFNSVLDPAEVEKEKGAIVEELRMYQDNPSMAIDMLSDKLVFGEHHPLGWDIGGTADTVRGMSREDLLAFYHQHYSAKSMILVVAGAIDAKKLKTSLRHFETQVSPKKSAGPAFYKKQYEKFTWDARPKKLAERLIVEERKVDQAQLMITLPGVKNHHPDSYAVALLASILGGGMSSRLFTEVREKRGLAYMIRAGTSAFRDTGLFYIQAGLDPARLKEALSVITSELVRIVNEPILPEELQNAKGGLTGQLALSMESSNVQANWFAGEYLFAPHITTLPQVSKKIEKVTMKQVQRVAKQLLKTEQMRLALIGPFTKQDVLGLLT
jgi:predicted Zn-dependent peptidase